MSARSCASRQPRRSEIRLGRIDELAASFVALEKQAETSPVLREMIRILNEEKADPVDKAIAYAERQRPAPSSGCGRRTPRKRSGIERSWSRS